MTFPGLSRPLKKRRMVGATGFEPATSWSQTTRSTKLSYAPISYSAVAEGQIRLSDRTRLRRLAAALAARCGVHYAVFKREGKYFLFPLNRDLRIRTERPNRARDAG